MNPEDESGSFPLPTGGALAATGTQLPVKGNQWRTAVVCLGAGATAMYLPTSAYASRDPGLKHRLKHPCDAKTLGRHELVLASSRQRGSHSHLSKGVPASPSKNSGAYEPQLFFCPQPLV